MWKNIVISVVLLVSLASGASFGFAATHDHHTPVEFKKPIIKTGEKSALQKLIDATKPGDTLLLEGRVYRGSVSITKPIKIQGVEGTEIHSLSNALTMTDSENIILENLVFDVEGIAIVANNITNLTLNNVQFLNSNAGLLITDSQQIKLHNLTIEGQEGHFKTKNHGVAIYNSQNVTATQSTVSNVLDGFYFERVNGIELHENTITNSRYATHFMYSDNMNITDNELTHNMTGFMIMIAKNLMLSDNRIAKNNTLNSLGVYFYDVENVVFQKNKLSENTIAMDIQNTKKVIAQHNEFQTNGTVLQVKHSPDFAVTDNQFYGNILTVRSDKERLQLANNFYDDYSGHDYDGDGIGDTPYIATNSFGQWMVKKPVYQYFIESPGVVVLNMMDTEVTGDHQLVVTDETPHSQKQPYKWKWDIDMIQLMMSTIVLAGMLVIRRKLI